MSRTLSALANRLAAAPRRRPAQALLALLAALLLTGCGSLLGDGRAAPTTWWLEPTDLSAAAPLPAVSVELTVVPGLDSDRILTLDDDAQLNHFAGALWPEHLPEWIPSLVERSLERAPVSGGGESCRLTLELRRFWARLDGEGKARSAEVALAGSVRCNGAAPTALSLRASEPISDHRLPTIVAAFQQAFDRTQQQLAREVAK